MTGRPHHLVLVDRGGEHRHRWAPTCSCGCAWAGQFRRRKAEAVKQYRRMVDSGEQGRRVFEVFRGGRRMRAMVQPKACTPTADLPEALR